MTIKGGTGYDAPWYTIDTVSVEDERRQLLLFAGLTEDTSLPDGRKVSEASLMQLMCIVSRLTQQEWSNRPSTALQGGGQANPPAKAAKPAAGHTAPAAAPSEGDDKAELLKAIEAAGSKQELTRLFTQHQSVMKDDADLMAALQARSASVK